MSKPTQADNVLAVLRTRGDRGAHTFELRGLYIANPSQRIAELEARGHVISRKRERLHGKASGARYVLVTDAQQPAAPLVVSDPDGQLRIGEEAA